MAIYSVRISDAGQVVRHELEAESIEMAVEMVEQQLLEAESITEGNPDCEGRTEWAACFHGEAADCSLRGESQDSSSWVKAHIEIEE